MKKLFLSLLFMSTVSYAADTLQKQKKVIIEFSNNEQEAFLEDSLKWSKTIREMLEDLGSSAEKRIPFATYSRTTFMCLQDLMIESKDPLMFTDQKLPLSIIREKFAKKLSDPAYQNINRRDLYLNAHFFDLHNKFKNVIASFYVDSYVDSLKNKLPTNKLPVIYEDIYPDAYLFAAGWLLHTLLSDASMKPVFEEKDFTFGSNVDFGPILSGSGSHKNFVCIWRAIPDRIIDHVRGNRYIPIRCLLFDMAQKGAMQDHNINRFYTHGDKCFCTLSQNNENMLSVRSGNVGRSIAYFCKLSKGLINESVGNSAAIKIIQHMPFTHDINEIVSVLFDDIHNVFKVIELTVKFDDAAEKITDQNF